MFFRVWLFSVIISSTLSRSARFSFLRRVYFVPLNIKKSEINNSCTRWEEWEQEKSHGEICSSIEIYGCQKYLNVKCFKFVVYATTNKRERGIAVKTKRERYQRLTKKTTTIHLHNPPTYWRHWNNWKRFEFLQPYWLARALPGWVLSALSVRYELSVGIEVKSWIRSEIRSKGNAKKIIINFCISQKFCAQSWLNITSEPQQAECVEQSESEKFKDSIRFNWENYIYCRSRVLCVLNGVRERVEVKGIILSIKLHTRKIKKWEECEKLWTSIYQFDPTQQHLHPTKNSGWWLTIMKISR